ncbi:hypothetical protein OG440_01680 [Streptomyces sp. NBC_00637]|uniref:hypothetical protein n=1 Tax=Streptomyces sp. NBC_00637 TaxID=2903667 RepID=UPI00324CFA54
MTLPKPLRTALMLVALYAVCVLFLRYRRDGMDWQPALLIGLAMTPLALLLAKGRDKLNGKTRDAGARWRDRMRRGNN